MMYTTGVIQSKNGTHAQRKHTTCRPQYGLWYTYPGAIFIHQTDVDFLLVVMCDNIMCT